MPSTYKTPGVYVEEIAKFPPSIAQVETAIPAFIGYTQQAIFRGKNLHDPDPNPNPQPVRITSLLEYEQYFGTSDPATGITVTIEEQVTIREDAEGNEVVRIQSRKVTGAIASPPTRNMYYAMQAYFANGGGPCYIVSVGSTGENDTVTVADLNLGVDAVAKIDEVTLFVFPESQALDLSQRVGMFDRALRQCDLLKDRFVIMDLQVPGADETIRDAATAFRNESLTLNSLKYGAVYAPNVETVFNLVYAESDVSLVRTQTPEPETDPEFDGGTMSDLLPTSADPNGGDLELYNLVKAAIDAIPVVLPPSPLVAGQYARVDNTRGVFKAPANVSLNGVIKPRFKITNDEQDDLNVHPSGKSINAIRTFTGKGTLIWGARTLAGNDNEWRYIPVRRFFNMAEESIKKGTEQFVFEPNDANTWTKVRAMIENFLILQWRVGALVGAKPEQAFFVKVGLNETMTALDILEGRMIVEIGMAVVRPAEFIILKFSHKMQES
jgi:phage tail sheath protein FI